jgi:hypothetical protein
MTYGTDAQGQISRCGTLGAPVIQPAATAKHIVYASIPVVVIHTPLYTVHPKPLLPCRSSFSSPRANQVSGQSSTIIVRYGLLRL